MIEIRPIKEEEKEEAQKLVPASCCLPDWANVWIVKDGQEIKGIFGMQQRLVVEPFFMVAHANGHSLMTMTWIDGFLRAYAGQVGQPGYEFFVGNENAQFQALLDRHFPVNGKEKPGKFYFRKFEG